MNVQAKASRDRILDSAGRILVRDDGDTVTIAAVAREAGISKGGLFYHFASKELLIEGLVARYVATFDELLDSAGDDPGAATRAYLRSVEHPGSPATQPVVAMLAAAVVNPASMATLRERYDRWQRRLDDDGVPAHLSATIRFAVDGLWLADTLDLAPAQGESRELIIGTLTTLLDRSSPR